MINGPSDPEILADIYDRRIRKSFKDECGNERFKPSNILTLALIPGLNEPKLHQLNHYLASLIDQLIELWHRINLPETFEHPNGKKIKVAVIYCSYDISTTRKLCRYISAKAAYYRFFKYVNYDDNNQPNFERLDDMDDWFKEKDAKEIRNNASEWKNCRTEKKRQKHSKDLSRSLSVYDKYTNEEYQSFHLLSNIEDYIAFDFKSFPGSFLKPLKRDVILQKDFQQLLAEFYCNTYNK
ncbi:5058_t:CDS:2, partial [Funneliformis mosseae]